MKTEALVKLSRAAAIATVFLTMASAEAAVVEKSCKCRDSSSGAFLELHTEHDDGKISIMRLETFTMAGVDNAAKCRAQMKKQLECGGTPAAAAAPSKKPTGVKIATVKEGGPFSEIGLQAGDLVTTINGQAATGDKDLAKIFETAKSGGKVDLGVIRRGQTMQLWYEFPKQMPQPSAETSKDEP